jgi:hypothetical protein
MDRDLNDLGLITFPKISKATFFVIVVPIIKIPPLRFLGQMESLAIWLAISLKILQKERLPTMLEYHKLPSDRTNITSFLS